MGVSIERTLSEPGRNWEGWRGASDDEIDRLLAASPYPLPAEFIELLRFSNGGEGDLALPPGWFTLNQVNEIIAGLQDPFLNESFSGFLFFGGNGGLESIAFDCRSGTQPFPVVMIDRIAGPKSAAAIAADAESFVAAIGQECPTDDHDNS